MNARRPSPIPASFALFAAAALLACESSNDDLGPTSSASSGAGGAGGSAGAGQGGAGGGGGGAPPVEPDGPARLTVVHGVVDAPSIQLCFAPWPDPAGAGAPWPAEPLDFGSSATIELPASVVPASGEVLVAVVAGDTDGADCGELVDDPTAFPDATIATLGVLPDGTLEAARSMVLVPRGCIAAGHLDDVALAVCGAAYTADAPAAEVTLGVMSRITDPDRVALQAVHASTGPNLGVYVRPSFEGALDVLVAEALSPGGVAPVPPARLLGVAELGSVSGAYVSARVPPSAAPYDVPLPTAIAPGGLTNADFANGEGVAFVTLGGPPGGPLTGWSEPFTIVAVRASP